MLEQITIEAPDPAVPLVSEMLASLPGVTFEVKGFFSQRFHITAEAELIPEVRKRVEEAIYEWWSCDAW